MGRDHMEQKKTVLAMGYFDGVHLGHGALLDRAKARASEFDAIPAVLTLDTHPDLLVRGKRVPLLCGGKDRAYLLQRFYGIESIYYVNFTPEVMRMPAEVFLDNVVERYTPVHFVVGENFRFGFGGRGTPEALRAWCAARAIGCDVVPLVGIGGAPVSSTRIRALVAEGEISEANALLGHPHLLTDTVRRGFHLGRTLEFPTVNMRFAEGVLPPRFGVYASRVRLPGGACRDAVTNIGIRPTFDKKGENGVTVETHIPGFDGDLYGQSVCVEFYGFLRAEKPFDGREALQAQMRRDTAAALAFLAGEYYSGGKTRE